MTGIEPVTPSLPRKYSTSELHRQNHMGKPFAQFPHLNILSGRRGSNPRPAAWKAAALPTELLPLIPGCPVIFSPCKTTKLICFYASRGGNRIRTCEDLSQRIYSPSQLAALVFPQLR